MLMKGIKGSIHLSLGAAGIALILLVAFVIINIAAPDLGSAITGAITNIVSAFK